MVVLATLCLLVLPRPAAAQSSTPSIKIGNLITLTGPNSTPGVGIDRGMRLAVEQFNRAGGVDGRKIEVITRDTQGDPTKAVNAALEMINKEHVDFIAGPTNSGEGLATTPVVARSKVPSIVIGVVEALVDPVKYPHAFRIYPSNTQWSDAVNSYALTVLKVKQIGLLGDTTGFGTSAVNLAEQGLKAHGAVIVYRGLVDANQTDVTADMRKAQSSGAQALVVWTNSAGLISRLLNARAEIGWDVPVVGHPSLGDGAVKPLLAKPENWRNVYNVGYRPMSYDDAGRLPSRTQKFLDEFGKGLRLDDTMLFFVASGYDTVDLIRFAVEAAGSTKPDEIKRVLETGRTFPGLYCTCTYSPTNHNGFATSDVVMNRADSFRNGTYTLAPGYGK
jgi:branched-chain amino acid transport system substrate-binding protein